MGMWGVGKQDGEVRGGEVRGGEVRDGGISV